MGIVSCTRCGAEWENLYIDTVLSEQERIKFRKGLGCPKCRTQRIDWDREQRLARISIRESLDDLQESYIVVSNTLLKGSGKKDDLTPGTERYRSLEEFFLSCQRAEERMKIAAQKGFITPEEIEWLNGRIRIMVTGVLSLSKKSPSIWELVIEMAETKPAIMRVIQFFTSSRMYLDSQFFTRRHEPRDLPPLYRSKVEKGV